MTPPWMLRHRDAEAVAAELRQRAALADKRGDAMAAGRLRRLATGADAYATQGRAAR